MRLILTYILLLASTLFAAAKTIDDVKQLYLSGDYDEAISKLSAVLKSTPKDGTANYYLGLCYIASDQEAKAKAPLQKAVERGVADASRQLAMLAMREYDMDDAAKYADLWEKQLNKDKKPIPDELGELRSKIVLMRNMLERVEQVEIIDSIVVDADAFFKHYRLSPSAGRLITGQAVDGIEQAAGARVAFVPENGREVFWSMRGPDGKLALTSAKVLDDGSVEEMAVFDGDLGQGGDADYPFFTSDGMTFYFANNGENSIGGYDIFLSRRSPDGSVLEPQNVGMPFNSAYDDYMLVVDDAAGLGWWATDRNQIPGSVTIYVFVPSDSRVNYDPDDPDIADFAFIRSIAATQKPGTDKAALLNNAALHASSESDQFSAGQFQLSLGDGRIYTHLSDFRNPQARQAMKQYIDRLAELDKMETQLAALRQKYAAGDRSTSTNILSLEKRILAARPVLTRLRNQAITLERK